MAETKEYAPIWIDPDGNEMLFAGETWVANDEQEAREIGWGGSLVEGVLLGVKFTGRVKCVVNGELPNVRAELSSNGAGGTVYLIAGPMFDEYVKKEAKKCPTQSS